MNAPIFKVLQTMMADAPIDCLPEPQLPPMDLGGDAVREIAAAVKGLSLAMGMETEFAEFVPMFSGSRSNVRIEVQLLNLQLALFRGMILLGYDHRRLANAMQRMLASGDLSLSKQQTAATAP
jgi:hypothetical protein